MVEALPFKVVVASVFVFAAVLVLARNPGPGGPTWQRRWPRFFTISSVDSIHAFFESRGSQAAGDEPLIMTTGPNRRNQSATPPMA